MRSSTGTIEPNEGNLGGQVGTSGSNLGELGNYSENQTPMEGLDNSEYEEDFSDDDETNDLNDTMWRPPRYLENTGQEEREPPGYKLRPRNRN